jgi:hypothetical protein
METQEQTQLVSYESFLTRKWVKELVKKIIDTSVYYDINNNFAKITIRKDKNQDVKESFFQSLVQLDVVNNGYINNKNIDSYLYYLLRNGKVSFVYYSGKYYMKNKSNEHVVNDRNFNIELLFNGDAYLLGIYKAWINRASQKEIKERMYLNLGQNDSTLSFEDESSIKTIYAGDTPIVDAASAKVIEIITTAMESNLKKPTSWLHKFVNLLAEFGLNPLGGKKAFLPYDFTIVLNDRQTIVDDVNNLQNGFNETFKEIIDFHKISGEKELGEE